MNGTGHRRQFIAQAARLWFPGGLCVSYSAGHQAADERSLDFLHDPSPHDEKKRRYTDLQDHA